MTTTPTGDPAWERTASAEGYGGHADKKDYQNLGAINPRTDISAAQFLRMSADLAAVTRVSPYSVITLLTDDTTPDDPTVTSVYQMDGNSTASYAGDTPPSGFPTCTRNGDGAVTVTWPSTASDEFSVSGTVAIKHVQAFVTRHIGYAAVLVTKISDVSFSFEAVNSAGTALTDVELTIEAW